MLGKMIGGKNICTKNQQKVNSINILSHPPVMINNGDQSTTSSSLTQNDSLESHIKVYYIEHLM